MENTDPKKINNTQLLNIVAFCALMQNGEGIKSKSANYILEKFHKYALQTDIAYHWGLDAEKQILVKAWADKWMREFIDHDHSTDEVDYMRSLAGSEEQTEKADEKRDELREDGIQT